MIISEIEYIKYIDPYFTQLAYISLPLIGEHRGEMVASTTSTFPITLSTCDWHASMKKKEKKKEIQIRKLKKRKGIEELRVKHPTS